MRVIMFDPLVAAIRRRRRSEWQQLCRARLVEFRIYAQENGEKVFILGLLLGVCTVLFYKPVIVIISLIALAYLIIMAVSDN
jgi:hypothetical protein